MVLSRTGILAEVIWNEIPSRRKEITLGRYVFMPNHVHGILFLNPEGSSSDENLEGHTADDVETGRALSPDKSKYNEDSDPGRRRFQKIGKTPCHLSWEPTNRP